MPDIEPDVEVDFVWWENVEEYFREFSKQFALAKYEEYLGRDVDRMREDGIYPPSPGDLDLSGKRKEGQRLFPRYSDIEEVPEGWLKAEIKKKYGGIEEFYRESLDLDNIDTEQEMTRQMMALTVVRGENVLVEIEEFLSNGHSVGDIAEVYPVTDPGIRNWVERAEIDIAEKQELFSEEYMDPEYWKKEENLRDLEEVAESYFEEKGELPSPDQLVQEGFPHIERILRTEHDLEYEDILSAFLGTKSTELDLMEFELESDVDLEEFLREKLVEEDMSAYQVSEQIGVSGNSVLRTAFRVGIEKEHVQRGKDYWTEWENYEAELKPVLLEYLEEEGEAPETEDLMEEGLGSIADAANKHFDLRLFDLYREVLDEPEDKPMAIIEAEYENDIDIEKLIKQDYLVEGRSLVEIGEEIGVPNGTLYDYKNHLGVPAQTELKRKDIDSPEDLDELSENLAVIRDVYEAVGDDKAFVDVVSLIMGEYIQFTDLYDVVVESELSKHLGERRQDGFNVGKLVDLSAGVIPLDRGEKVEQRFKKMMRDHRNNEIGPTPDLDEIDRFLQDLRQEKQREPSDIDLELSMEVRENMFDYLIEDTVEIKEEFLER